MTNPVIFDEQLRQYTISYEGIQFCWDEKPTDANLDTAKLLAVNYHKNIDTIVTFIYNEIRDLYGDITIDDVKSRIGMPIIEPERDAVTYCEQTFDDTHIFSFTFWDDEFKDLHYFAIDGYMWSLLCYIHRIIFCISIFAIDLDGFRFSAICYMI